MILILSETGDISTTKVTEYLFHYKIPYLRIDREDNLDVIDYINISNESESITFIYRNKKYYSADFSIVWYRRGVLNFSFPKYNDSLNTIDNKIQHSIGKHLNEEITTMIEYIYQFFMNTKLVINDPRKYNINKLMVLSTAKSVGIKIPETHITRTFENIGAKNNLITKNIQDVIPTYFTDIIFHQNTQNTEIKDNNMNFYYSLFQDKVSKKFEIRTFFFFEMVYSMAIFSQSNPLTETDFRHYDSEKPNRMVPFIIPCELKEKLLLLMKKLNLESGSVDLIFDGKDYYFLEVNPVGQFDFVSGLCNYQIEYQIAKYLTHNYERNVSNH